MTQTSQRHRTHTSDVGLTADPPLHRASHRLRQPVGWCLLELWQKMNPKDTRDLSHLLAPSLLLHPWGKPTSLLSLNMLQCPNICLHLSQDLRYLVSPAHNHPAHRDHLTLSSNLVMKVCLPCSWGWGVAMDNSGFSSVCCASSYYVSAHSHSHFDSHSHSQCFSICNVHLHSSLQSFVIFQFPFPIHFHVSSTAIYGTITAPPPRKNSIKVCLGHDVWCWAMLSSDDAIVYHC